MSPFFMYRCISMHFHSISWKNVRHPAMAVSDVSDVSALSHQHMDLSENVGLIFPMK